MTKDEKRAFYEEIVLTMLSRLPEGQGADVEYITRVAKEIVEKTEEYDKTN